MAAKKAAGLLLYHFRDSELKVFLTHPGGPFWAKKDIGAWTIPKGEFEGDEYPIDAAKREFHEETGCIAEGNFVPLRPLKQRGGKTVYAWAVEGDCDADAITSNLFSMEWPPRSGKQREFPEVDRAGWFTLTEAKEKIQPAQVVLLEELERLKKG
jgi:predicted NUDIX family NTP pyrophosphohydrolase